MTPERCDCCGNTAEDLILMSQPFPSTDAEFPKQFCSVECATRWFTEDTERMRRERSVEQA